MNIVRGSRRRTPRPETFRSMRASLLMLIALVPDRPALGECSHLDDPLQILDLYLEMAPADWEVVRRDTTFDLERPASFRCGDEAPLPVMVRRKRSDALPSDADPVKVSLKVDFNDRVSNGKWYTHNKISLESGVIRQRLPGALLREGVCWQIMIRSGAIAGAAAWVRVHLNGSLLGVYTRVEEIDKSFLRRRIGEDEGFLYKFDPGPDGVHRRLTREGQPDPFLGDLCWEPFDSLCPLPADPRASLDEHLVIHQYLTMAAVNTLLGNTDGLMEARQNYFFYNSAEPRLYFPWDLDLTLLPENLDRHPHSSEVDRLFFVAAPGLRPYFDRVLRRLCEDTMSEANIDLLLDDVARAVGPAIEADPLNHLEGGFAAELARIRSWLKARVEFLRGVLPPSAPSPLVLNEVLASNQRTNRDEGGEFADWVEVLNRSANPVSLEGHFLSDDPHKPLRWAFPEGVLAPGGRLLVWCDHDVFQGPYHTGFQLDQEGEAIGLYELRDGIVRALDFISFGPQESDRSIGRSPDGAARLTPLPCPTPGLPNDGECPKPETFFLRGDASDDGSFDLTDPILLLLHLFLGGELACRRSADVDDGGTLEITDAVEFLGYLFLGGPPPAPPFPHCGADGTKDPLDCLAPAGCANPRLR
jgi:hypothetical protein